MRIFILNILPHYKPNTAAVHSRFLFGLYRNVQNLVWLLTQEESNGEQTSSRRRYEQLEKDGDEDDEELVQQAAKYDREWDDWKDANPRGSGNKANKNI